MDIERTTQTKRTFCRVCEPACGLIATVEGDRLVALEADKAHPISKGFVCNKGIYGLDIHNDPDRLNHPLKQVAPGKFEAIDWDTALTEIALRLKTVVAEHGHGALGSYTGNPTAFNSLFGPAFGGFLQQLGVSKNFSSGTQDCANKFAGSEAVFGTRTLHPLPDIDQTGNLGRRGGNFYSLGFYERSTAAGSAVPEGYIDTPYGEVRKPGGVGINLPGNLLASYLTDPDEPIRALFVNSGNPVLSIAGEQHTRDALDSLDLLVCVDIYRSATAEYADYVLPAAGAFEREDVNITGMGLQFQPSVQYTEAVVPPAFERKPEWWIFEKLNQIMGFQSLLDGALDEDGQPNVWGRVDAMLRSQGRNMNELKAEQIIALERSDPAEFTSFLQHEDKLVDCFPAIFLGAIERMEKICNELEAAPANQLKLIGKRDAYVTPT